MPQAEGECVVHRHHSRTWEPPPQSLRDSSRAGGAIPAPDSQLRPCRGDAAQRGAACIAAIPQSEILP